MGLLPSPLGDGGLGLSPEAVARGKRGWVSGPPVGLCSQRPEASLPCSPVSPVPGTEHRLSKWLLNESLTGLAFYLLPLDSI